MNEQELLAHLEKLYGKAKLCSNGWIRIPCPTCASGDRKKMKRYVNTVNLGTNCFICTQRMTPKELMCGETVPVMDRSESNETKERKVNEWANKLPVYKSIPINQLEKDHPAVKFFFKDHLYDLDRYYNENGIIYCPSDGGHIFNTFPFITSANRLIFPVVFKGSLVGWQMRSIPGTIFGDREDVIRYYHVFNKGNYLYNYDNAKLHNRVVLTEGVKKALKFPNGVASLGKGLTPIQIQMLQEWREVVVFLDGEDSTQQLAKKVTKIVVDNGRRAINIDPRKYGFPSPDEATVEVLNDIVSKEWRIVYGEP